MGLKHSSRFNPPDSSTNSDSPTAESPQILKNSDMSSSSSSSHQPDDTQSTTNNPDSAATPPESSVIKPSEETDAANNNGDRIEAGRGGGEEEDEQEEGECGFCVFMKGGGCKESFVAWEDCVEEAEKTKEDVVEKCFEVTSTLRKCMQAHADYYEPILRAEKAAEEEAVKELEKEKSDNQKAETATSGNTAEAN